MGVKEKLMNGVKGSKVVYSIYYYVVSSLVKLLKLFIKPDDKLILFVSYGGRYFNDSPRCLYESMQNDKRFKSYKLVWAFRNPSNFKEVENRVKIDSLSYFITALKARCWITNVHIERGLDFKGKKTFYFNTTHTILPKVNSTGINKEVTFTTKAKPKFDCLSVQCEFERDIIGANKNKVVVVGYPKNDILVHFTGEYREEIRNRLNIPRDKTVIMYAPTYREGYLSGRPLSVDFKKWRTVLGDDYFILFRAHPVYASALGNAYDDGYIMDVSNYSNNNDLLIVSDILVSDYSGIFFEFGVQDKLMFCYAYDYEEYTKIRPLYFDIRAELPGGYMNEDELLHYILNGDKEEIKRMIKVFRAKYIQACGDATEKSLNIIYQHIQ